MIESANSTPRRRRAILAFALAASFMPSTTAASTDNVRVTAGEHGEFSRVVFRLDGIGYRTVPEPKGLRVMVPNALAEFQYDDVYPRRRAHRIVGAEPVSDEDGAGLRLRFDCDCGVRTFMLDTRLVVDIFDSSPGVSDAPPADDAPEVVPVVGADDRAGTVSQAAHRKGLTRTSDPGQPRAEFMRRVEGSATPDPYPPEPATAPDVDGFNQKHLERMLAWAIDQGHLTDASQAGAGQSSPSAQNGQPSSAAATPPPTDQPSPMAAPSDTVAPLASPTEASETGPAPFCPDRYALDMAVLGGAGSFDAELVSRQDALSRALATGRNDLEAQYALAGFYLARLMPQEALAALGKAGAQRQEPTRVWLEAAALVLADRSGEVAADDILASACKSADAQLWRAVVLAAQGPVAPQVLQNDGIVERLAAYPPDLRLELGLRLVEAGMGGTAPAVLEQLLGLVEDAVATAEARARVLFLRGRIAAERGDFAGAKANWRAATGLPGKGGARATLALLEADLGAGDLDEREALFELERLAYDWRGDPLQLPIARVAAAIHEQQGRLVQALRALEEVTLGSAGRANGRAAARLATDLMRRTYVNRSPALSADLLAAFWRYEGFVPPGPKGTDIRLAFAQALIAHGLPGTASNVLEPIVRSTNEPLADQATELLVEADIAAQEPSRALEVLRTAARSIATAKPRRNLLAARALAALGRFAEAAGILQETTGDEARRRQADYLWKAGLWQKSAGAYRAQLRERQQDEGDLSNQAVVRLAAAAYMAQQPAIFSEPPTGAVGGERIMSAFAPLPPLRPEPGSDASRSAAAHLLEQARHLGELAEQYGLREPASQ